MEISKCTNPGLFVDLRHFHLHMVGITDDQHERYMKQVVESEKKDTELYKQGKKTFTCGSLTIEFIEIQILHSRAFPRCKIQIFS